MIEVKMNSERVQRAIDRLVANVKNLRPAFNEIGEHLIASTRARFDTGTDPDGKKWAANSSVTLARKKGSRPLIGETKQLMRQLSYQSRPDQLLFGSSMEYAAMHQFGGTKAQFPNLWGDIPARPFLGITAHDENVIEEIVEDEIMRGIG